ncbi:MAG: FtsX-like permease family protein [Bacteroidales bacterium]|nr:FtsX-like permease family protein [Bacteroidales bacterium]
MRAERFIARRLRFKGRLAEVAISVSFFVMILSLAISGGFRAEIHQGISDIAGDVRLSGSEEPLEIRPSYFEQLLGIAGVEKITPAVWKPGIVKGENDICGVLVKGTPMPDSCSLQAIIPEQLGKKLALKEGDRFTTYFIEDKVRARRFTVAGTYQGITDSNDALVVLVPLADMQRLCGWTEEQASVLEVDLKERYSSEIDSQLKADELYLTSLTSHEEDEDILQAATARRRYPQLFDWLDLIDFNVVAIIFLMTIVAGFNMISGLLILLFRHISTIGTLKAMGMGNRSIAGVFLRVAARIVFLGMLAGNAAALLFCFIQGSTHFIRLNPANYFISFVPVHIDPSLVLVVDIVAFGAIMLLLLIPTLFISKVDPAKTVRVR